MEYRSLQHAKPSLLGLGCMRLPKADSATDAIDFEAAQAMVDAAIEGGINYFDTAYPYHGRTSEKFVGQALKKYPRESYYLATKMPLWAINTPEDIERIFAEQLENCQTEYFDFYLFHAVNKERFEAAQALGLYRFLAEKKKQGIIRHLGFSFHDTPEVLQQICAAYPWDFAQLQLNYLDWEMQRAKEQYEILQQHHIPCIVMEPVRGGALANLGAEANAVLQAAQPQASIASWALRWVAGLPGVVTVLSGMSNPAQLQDNLQTVSPFVPLTPSQHETLQQALAVYKENNLIPCTGCRYCMDCPCGVDIPLAFRTHNQYAISRHKPDFAAGMEAAHPEACMACGACLDQCPQAIAIPQKMQDLCEMLR